MTRIFSPQQITLITLFTSKLDTTTLTDTQAKISLTNTQTKTTLTDTQAKPVSLITKIQLPSLIPKLKPASLITKIKLPSLILKMHPPQSHSKYNQHHSYYVPILILNTVSYTDIQYKY